MITDRSLDNVTTDNQRAKQQMNQMYLDQQGAKAKKSVINFFAKSSIPFSIASILFSAFGFYFDLLDGMGALSAIILGLGLGVFIEGSKHFSTKGAFADFKSYWRIGLALLAFSFTFGAMVYHYKSLNTYANIQVRSTIEKQNDREIALKIKALSLIENAQNSNKDLSQVLKNGSALDDSGAVKAISSNNNLANNLLALSSKSDTSTSLLYQANKTAKQNKNTLLVIFISVELFSLFGVIAKGLLASETSDPVKSVISTQNKLDTLEENVIKMVETALIKQTMNRVKKSLKEFEGDPSPTPTYSQENFYQNQPNYNFLTNAYKYAPNPENTNNPLGLEHRPKTKQKEEIKTKAKPENTNDACDPCLDEKPKLKENLNNGEKVLDLMMYNYQDSQIILALFDNGSIGKGERLVKKSLVLAELEDQGVKEDDYVTLLRRLKKQKLVRFDVGYFSNCDLKNIVKVG